MTTVMVATGPHSQMENFIKTVHVGKINLSAKLAAILPETKPDDPTEEYISGMFHEGPYIVEVLVYWNGSIFLDRNGVRYRASIDDVPVSVIKEIIDQCTIWKKKEDWRGTIWGPPKLSSKEQVIESALKRGATYFPENDTLIETFGSYPGVCDKPKVIEESSESTPRIIARVSNCWTTTVTDSPVSEETEDKPYVYAYREDKEDGRTVVYRLDKNASIVTAKIGDDHYHYIDAVYVPRDVLFELAQAAKNEWVKEP